VWARWETQKRLVRRADIVIIPEANRSLILKHFSRSRARFLVVPNRPADDTIPVSASFTRTADAFREHGGAPQCRRFLIYQGVFLPSRCLQHAIRAFKQVSHTDAGLILMGGEPSSSIYEELASLAADDPRIVLLPRIAPPRHLEITAGCAGGILLYAPGSLNSIYCAPNKIYEYASFGLGMILPDYPGVARLNHEYRLGAICDPTSPDSIASAMTAVLQRSPEDHRQACRRFLESTDRPADIYKRLYNTLSQETRKRQSGKRAA
jgi:glycosyltransferase involved in cell wall biosynthesis